MKNKIKIQAKSKLFQIIIFLIIVSVFFLGISFLLARPPKQKSVSLPGHTMPYVDGNEAVGQVENFYKLYTSPNPAYAMNKNKTVETFGSNNLEFYYSYYNHGFDPITCSTLNITSLNHTLESTGAVAKVNTNINYTDGSSAVVQSNVVLNDEGLDIDSIQCPGNKGNLPAPSS